MRKLVIILTLVTLLGSFKDFYAGGYKGHEDRDYITPRPGERIEAPEGYMAGKGDFIRIRGD